MENTVTTNTVSDNPLVNLIGTLNQQQAQKNDIVTKGAKITYRDGQLWIQEHGPDFNGFRGYAPTDLCHSQIAEKLGIPKAYYDRMMKDYPELLSYNINMWLAKDERIKYLLRTFNVGTENMNIARALLSDRFKILDNWDVLHTALKAIKEMGVKVEITKACVTEKKMYLHVICPEVEQQADAFLREYLKHNDAAGNGIISGFVISNSEVGLGSFEIRPRAVIVKCNNGLVGTDERFRRVHLGGKMDEGIQWSDKTKNKNIELVMSQTQDAIKTFLSSEYLGTMINKVAEAHNIKLEHPIDTVQHVCKELSFTEAESRDILNYFLHDGDHSASGVFQAVTRKAQTLDADKQYDVEAAAFGMLGKIKKWDKPFSNN